MPHGRFEFDAEKSPAFSLSELKRMKQRALAEPGAVEQFQEMAGTVQQFILGAKIDAVLLTGLMLTELALHIMAERERSHIN
jgi:hypothetical protein